jgi:hypothetical protein
MDPPNNVEERVPRAPFFNEDTRQLSESLWLPVEEESSDNGVVPELVLRYSRPSKKP